MVLFVYFLGGMELAKGELGILRGAYFVDNAYSIQYVLKAYNKFFLLLENMKDLIWLCFNAQVSIYVYIIYIQISHSRFNMIHYTSSEFMFRLIPRKVQL